MFILEQQRPTSTWVPSMAYTNVAVQTPLSEDDVLAAPIFETVLDDVDTGFCAENSSTTRRIVEKELKVPAVKAIKPLSVGAGATVIQIWEGVVLSVDHAQSAMTVKLRDRKDAIAEHTAEIDLQWIVEQDQDLVVPGSVFYWTIYKERMGRSTIRNTQEIRFRRLPNWTQSQLNLIEKDVERLASKFATKVRIAD